MSGQKWLQMACNPYGPHPRSTAAVGNTEGFVQIQVTDICPNIPRTAQTHLSIHIRPVHVNLPTMGMDNLTDFPNSLFKYTVSRGISNHQGGKFAFVLLGFCFQVIQINIALVITLHSHHFHPTHYGTSGIGAVGRLWNQTDSPMPLAPMFVVLTNHL